MLLNPMAIELDLSKEKNLKIAQSLLISKRVGAHRYYLGR